MKRTIFPPRIRQVQQTQATAQTVREVRTRDEYMAAITATIALGSGRGTTILLVAPFANAEPLPVPVGCDGLIIRAASRFAMPPIGVVSSLFHVLSTEVTIDGVRAESGATVGGSRAANYFQAFVSASGSSARTLTCLFCYASADAWVDGTDVITYRLTLLSCDLLSTDPAGATTAVTLFGNGADVIAFCSFSGGAGTSIVSGTNASGSIIVGNTVNGDIDTSASFAGGARLAANSVSGSKILHALDTDADVLALMRSSLAVADANASLFDVAGRSSVVYTSLSATRTVSIPNASSYTDRTFIVKDASGSASSTVKIICDADGSETIDGAANKEITTAYGAIVLYSDGSDWFTITATASAAPVGWTTVTKTATQTVQSNPTLFNDSTLLFTMAANTTYRIRGKIAVLGDSTADLVYALTGPATPTQVQVLVSHINTTTFTNEVCSDYASTSNSVNISATQRAWIEFDAVIENGANSGTFAFQWAQLVSTAANTSVLKGSYLEYAVVA